MSESLPPAQRANAVASARLATSWLLSYPDEALLAKLDLIANAVAELPDDTRAPLQTFLDHVSDTPFTEIQKHYVALFDMRRRACPFLTYWTDGDTRNRGMAILRFKQAYEDAGFSISSDELPDHIAVLLEFAAVGDRLTGEALLAEHAAPIGLLRDALQKMDSVYVHVVSTQVRKLYCCQVVIVRFWTLAMLAYVFLEEEGQRHCKDSGNATSPWARPAVKSSAAIV